MNSLFKGILERKFIFSIGGILVLGVVAWAWSRAQAPAVLDTIIVEKQDLIQEVSVTGTVQSVQELDLAFEIGGKVDTVNVKLGDMVQAGQILATLTNGNAYSQVTQAQAGLSGSESQLKQYQANLDAELARLDSLRKGSSAEEIDVEEVTVQNAERSLADAQNNLTVVSAKAEVDMDNLIDDIPDMIYESYATADEAVRIQTDALFDNERFNAELTFVVTDSQFQNDAEKSRDELENVLLDWQEDLGTIPSDSAELEAQLDLVSEKLELVRTYLMKVMSALNYSAGVSTYQTDVNTARADVNTQIEAVTTQKQAIAALRVSSEKDVNTALSQVNTAQNTLDSARSQLALKQAGATDEELKIQEAAIASAEADLEIQSSRIEEARANLLYYQSVFDQTVITAPFAGIVTMQDAKEGAIASPNTPLIGLLSEAEFEMEAKVPEVDIAKLELGMEASVTLDAYGSGQTFEAKVVFIDRGEIVIDGVSTYLVKLQFQEQSELIKSGMTANIDIKGATRTQVLAIPQRTIIRDGGRQFVRVLGNGIIEEVEVTTGLRASDGNIEILTGLSEGDEVVLYTE